MNDEIRVAVTTFEGAIVTAPPAGDWPLLGNRDRVLGWEVLNLVSVGGGQVAIRTAHGFYVSARGGIEGWVLEGYSPVVREWERFVPVLVGEYVALRTTHGRFVSPAPVGEAGALLGEATSVGEPQRFGGGEIVPAPPDGAPASAFVPFAPGGWIFRRPLRATLEGLIRGSSGAGELESSDLDRDEPNARRFDGPWTDENGVTFWF